MEEKNNSFTTQQWIDATPEAYDVSKEAEAELFPVLKQLNEVCERLGIPYVIRCVVKDDGKTNSAVTGMALGGPTRATPEVLAMSMLRNFSYDYIELMQGLADACNQKYFPAGVQVLKLDPDDPQALEKLIRGATGE